MRQIAVVAGLVVFATAGALVWTESAEAKKSPKSRPYMGVMTSGQEPGLASPTDAFGVVYASYDEGTKVLTVSYSTTNLSGLAIAAHVHEGPPGTNGSIVFPFTDVTPASATESFGPLTNAQLGSLKKGLFYVNVHTPGAPGGEVRGQLLPAPSQVAY